MSRSRCAAVYRQSQGDDESVSLSLQREKGRALAAELGDPDPHEVDLGVHTGFSIHTRDVDDDNRIDANEEILDLLDRLEAGEFDYLVAWDDTRLARDDFFADYKRAVKLGEAEFAFVDNVDDVGSLTFSVTRDVEQHVKQKEIEKSREAVKARLEKGHAHGRPRFGMEYSKDGTEQVPGDDFDTVREILRYDRMDKTLREIEELTGVGYTTVRNVLKRRQWYVSKEKLVEN